MWKYISQIFLGPINNIALFGLVQKIWERWTSIDTLSRQTTIKSNPVTNAKYYILLRYSIVTLSRLNYSDAALFIETV